MAEPTPVVALIGSLIDTKAKTRWISNGEIGALTTKGSASQDRGLTI
jgi:hypothetical protein